MAENITAETCCFQGFHAKTGHIQGFLGTVEKNYEIQGFSGICAKPASTDQSCQHLMLYQEGDDLRCC